jgi:diguanylate cyclase (GGDEF)-like protein
MTVFPPDLSDEALRCLVEALTESGQAISLYDAEDRLRFANKTYRRMFMGGYEGPLTFPDILRHASEHGLGVRIDDGDVEAFIARTLSRRRSVPRKSFETDLLTGQWFWMDQTILPSGWVLSVGADITVLKHNEKTLRVAHDEALLAARTDPLTGLPNRRHIFELLDEALATERAGSSLCVAAIDIDQFKAINDTYGHDVGDAVLAHFAGVCRDRVRVNDRLGRTGGEEFLLILPEVRLADAVLIIERVRQGFPAAPPAAGRPELPCTFSAGVTEVLPQDDRSSVLRRADRALYAAKADGRDCTRVSRED